MLFLAETSDSRKYASIRRLPNSFLSYKHLKVKLRVFLTGCMVTMVTYYGMEITIIGSLMAGHFCDTKVAHSKQW